MKSPKPAQQPLSTYYDDRFYEGQATSLIAARLILPHVWQYLQPQSVLDVGCGRGAWLIACRELGSTNLIGLDGDWNDQTSMLDPSIRFTAVDLNRPFAIESRVDLAISVEVAEHLEPRSSHLFVECLTKASDAVVFGAAYIGQCGTNHINERRHSWWASAFGDNGYVPFDLFRPELWGEERIPFWYRQNTFLYTRKGSAPYAVLTGAGAAEVPDIWFLDCIHPELWEDRTGLTPFRAHLRDLTPSLFRALRRRLSR